MERNNKITNRLQRYNKEVKFSKKIEISGFHWLILNVNQKEVCAKLGITPAYTKHIPMFLEFLDYQRKGEKKTFAYAKLGEKYGMHTSSVRKVIHKLLGVVRVSAQGLT